MRSKEEHILILHSKIAIRDAFRCFALCRAIKIYNKRNVRIHIRMKFVIQINITKATNNISGYYRVCFKQSFSLQIMFVLCQNIQECKEQSHTQGERNTSCNILQAKFQQIPTREKGQPGACSSRLRRVQGRV